MTDSHLGVAVPTFDLLPDSARLWIFGVERDLSVEERERLLSEVDAFLSGWKAHGHPLAAAREWRYDRFLLVAVDDRMEPPSGCSIDALVRILRGLESSLGLRLLGGGDIWMREGTMRGEIIRVSRAEFRELGARGEVGPGTTVFDLSLTRLSDLRAGRWELSAGESWHSRYLSARSPGPE
jgi:hypothetical protein